MARRPNISKKELDKLLDEIQRDFYADYSDHQTYVHVKAQSLEDTFSPNDSGEKDYPWVGASNVTPPLVGKTVRAIWPRFVNAILGITPIVQAVAVKPEDRGDAEARAAWHNHRLLNLLPRFKHTLTNCIIEMVHSGDSVLHPRYELEKTYEPEWRVVDNFTIVPDAQGQPLDFIPKTDEEVIDEVFEDANKVTKKGGGEYKVRYIEDGHEYTAFVSIDRDDDDIREDQLSVTIEGERYDSRLHLDKVDSGSLVAPAGATGYQRDQAKRLTHLMWMHVDEIEADPNFHNLTKSDLKYLRSKAATGDNVPGEPAEAEQVLDELTGTPKIWGVTGQNQMMIRVLVHYRPHTSRGRRREMIFWVIPALKKIGRWENLKSIYGHGQRPYVNFQFIPLANRPRGLGIWHLIHPYQDEAATILNQMNDRENLVNNPRMMVQHNAGITAGRLRGSPPGDTLGVKDIGRVAPLTWQIDPHGGFPVYQTMVAAAEQAAASGDFQAGVSPSRPNAPRTARGTMALLAEGATILDAHILLVNESFSELILQIDGLDEQYLPPEVRFLTTGKQELKIERQQFRSKVRFYLTGNTTNTNLQVQQSTSQLMYQSLIGNPIITGEFVQMPAIAIEAQYRLVEDLIKKHSPQGDASLYLKDLQDYLQAAQQFQQQQAQAMQQQGDVEDAMLQSEEDRKDLDSQTKAFGAAANVRGQNQQSKMELFKAQIAAGGNGGT